jgi:hypothetical protein
VYKTVASMENLQIGNQIRIRKQVMYLQANTPAGANMIRGCSIKNSVYHRIKEKELTSHTQGQLSICFSTTEEWNINKLRIYKSLSRDKQIYLLPEFETSDVSPWCTMVVYLNAISRIGGLDFLQVQTWCCWR